MWGGDAIPLNPYLLLTLRGWPRALMGLTVDWRRYLFWGSLEKPQWLKVLSLVSCSTMLGAVNVAGRGGAHLCQVDLCECDASIVYRVSSQTAEAGAGL